MTALHADETTLVSRVCRATGTHVELVYNAGADESQPWETICVDHGGVCSHETRALAERWLSHPDEWCEDCMHGPGTLDGTRDLPSPIDAYFADVKAHAASMLRDAPNMPRIEIKQLTAAGRVYRTFTAHPKPEELQDRLHRISYSYHLPATRVLLDGREIDPTAWRYW